MSNAEDLITNVAITLARPDHEKEGILAWLTCVIANIVVLDGIALRRTRDGRPVLSFPRREDSAGRQHPYIRAAASETGQQFERAIFKAIAKELARGNPPPA